MFVERGHQIQLVAGTYQCISPFRITAGVGFLAFPKHRDLLVPGALWMFKAKHAEPLKLAGQKSRAGTKRRDRDDKHEYTFGYDPAEAMFKETSSILWLLSARVLNRKEG